MRCRAAVWEECSTANPRRAPTLQPTQLPSLTLETSTRTSGRYCAHVYCTYIHTYNRCTEPHLCNMCTSTAVVIVLSKLSLYPHFRLPFLFMWFPYPSHILPLILAPPLPSPPLPSPQGVLTLADDPFPDVAQMAGKVVSALRKRAEQSCPPQSIAGKMISSSTSAPSSPTRRSTVMGMTSK